MPSSPLNNASCLRARQLDRSMRRANYVGSPDSTRFSLLDLKPVPGSSATELFFNGLLAAPGMLRRGRLVATLAALWVTLPTT
jgi:hypothetical protein